MKQAHRWACFMTSYECVGIHPRNECFPTRTVEPEHRAVRVLGVTHAVRAAEDGELNTTRVATPAGASPFRLDIGLLHASPFSIYARGIRALGIVAVLLEKPLSATVQQMRGSVLVNRRGPHALPYESVRGGY